MKFHITHKTGELKVLNQSISFVEMNITWYNI